MKKLLVFSLLVLLAGIVAACGGGDGGGGGAAQQTNADNATPLVIKASNFEFDQAEYTVKAGEPVEFSIENVGGVHAYEIKGLGINIGQNDKKQYTINQPGEYEIVCSIFCGTGHGDMVSKLIVTE